MPSTSASFSNASKASMNRAKSSTISSIRHPSGGGVSGAGFYFDLLKPSALSCTLPGRCLIVKSYEASFIAHLASFAFLVLASLRCTNAAWSVVTTKCWPAT